MGILTCSLMQNQLRVQKSNLYDLTGRLVKELQFSNISLQFSESISFQNAAKGLYVLKIKNGTKQTSRKLVIE